MEEVFTTSKPNDPFLHKTISYYYFHSASSDSYPKKFVYYPNFKNALTVYKNSRIEYGHNHSKSTPDKKHRFSFLYSGVQKQSRTSEIETPFDKIGIVFQELGINHFIEIPLCEVNKHPIEMSFDYFGDEFNELFESVYKQETTEAKVALLDKFFLSKYIDFQEFALIDCIKTILNSDQKMKVQELSIACQIHRKTLLRLFKKHLCCSPKEYLDIVQFRRALNDYLLLNQNVSLTEAALDNQYYDQAQFIKHFKKRTGNNPKKFFLHLQHLGEEDTFWTFQ